MLKNIKAIIVSVAFVGMASSANAEMNFSEKISAGPSCIMGVGQTVLNFVLESAPVTGVATYAINKMTLGKGAQAGKYNNFTNANGERENYLQSGRVGTAFGGVISAVVLDTVAMAFDWLTNGKLDDSNGNVYEDRNENYDIYFQLSQNAYNGTKVSLEQYFLSENTSCGKMIASIKKDLAAGKKVVLKANDKEMELN